MSKIKTDHNKQDFLLSKQLLEELQLYLEEFILESNVLLLPRFDLLFAKCLDQHGKAVAYQVDLIVLLSYWLVTIPTLNCGSFLAPEWAMLHCSQHFAKRVAKDFHSCRSIEVQLATHLE